MHLCDTLCHNRENWYGNEAAIFTMKIKLIPKKEKAWQSRLFSVFSDHWGLICQELFLEVKEWTRNSTWAYYGVYKHCEISDWKLRETQLVFSPWQSSHKHGALVPQVSKRDRVVPQSYYSPDLSPAHSLFTQLRVSLKGCLLNQYVKQKGKSYSSYHVS